MTLNAQAIFAHQFEPFEQVVSDKDAILFALSIGVGRDPLDLNELGYVYEANLKTFPTLPIVLGHPGPWMANPTLGITRHMLVHASQRLELHGALHTGTTLVASNRIIELVDKGPDHGAIIVLERRLHDKATGQLLARIESGNFCRADGGFGGPRQLSREFKQTPSRVHDTEILIETYPNQALLYRLNGDRNPLHADPAFAAKAGFPRPILHGLCTYSVAALGLMRLHPGKRLSMLEARFSRPVYPGEEIRIEAWSEPLGIAFRAWVDAREVVVLDRGFATFE